MPRLINAKKQGASSLKSKVKAFIFLQTLLLISCQQKNINSDFVLKPIIVESRIKNLIPS
jgi:hypothetical protein